MENKDSPTIVDVFALPGMLERLCNIVEDVYKVHQEPQKLIIDLNVISFKDSNGVKTLSICTQTSLLVHRKASLSTKLISRNQRKWFL